MNKKEASKNLLNENLSLTRKIGQDIEIVKKINGRPITAKLISIGSKYKLIFPNYIFHSSISHFAPAEDEKRMCRNKKVLISIIETLKKTGMWEYVENKDFLVVNKHNFKSDKNLLKHDLKKLKSNLR